MWTGEWRVFMWTGEWRSVYVDWRVEECVCGVESGGVSMWTGEWRSDYVGWRVEE